ncbi:MAG: EAL domain-containing protein [Candidatus Thiodiazotropha sp.]
MVEDEEDDVLLLADRIESSGYSLQWKRVDDETSMIQALSDDWDFILSDFSMPRFSGTRALEIARQHDPDLPFIFVSGTIGEVAAVTAIKSGAHDYVLKSDLSRLIPTIERQLREVNIRRERRIADETLRKLSLAVNQAVISIFITDQKGVIEYVNPAFETLTGYTAEEALGQTPAFLRFGKHDAEFYENLWWTVTKGKVFNATVINRRKNGGLFYEDQIITPLKDQNGNITHYVSTGRDITSRIQAEEELRRLIAIVETTPDLVSVIEPDGRLRYLNRAGYRLLGIDVHRKPFDLSLKHIFPVSVAQQFITDILPKVKKTGTWEGEIRILNSQSKEIPFSVVVLSHLDDTGELAFFSTIARDISERIRFEAELRHQATHDSLTNLPNRLFLKDRIKSAIEHAKRYHNNVAVLFLDLDDFKRVNDSLGHEVGDILLQKVAKRLDSCLRANDTLARHGGDEFTIVIGELLQSESALVILRNIKSAFERPLSIALHQIYVTFSTGIALYPHDGDNVEELMRNADTAMYQAKASGSGQYRFYASDMNARGHELLALEVELRQALERHEFQLYYQPQISLRTGRVKGLEGLLRWHHPNRGILAPSEFISILENTGLIIPLGERVIREACRQHRLWRSSGYPDIRISVNVSTSQFNDSELLEKIKYAIDEEQMPNQQLELEITENILMQDPVSASGVLQSLNSLGVRTAIDDFGTGYSSLAYLKRFPLNVLKIDQEFVGDLMHDPSDAAIVEASISMAQKLGLEVVAEGVEHSDQIKYLRDRGCDFAQGYYCSKARHVDEVGPLLKRPWRWGESVQ